MPQSEIPNPHDRFFNQTFSRPAVARDFVGNDLPAQMTVCLDLNTLGLDDTAFVDAELTNDIAELQRRIEELRGQLER